MDRAKLIDRKRSVFFIICIKNEHAYDKITSIPYHCWGWFMDVSTAILYTKENITDISQNNLYNYVLIEEVPEGVIPENVSEVKWFKFNSSSDKFIECAKPSWSYSLKNWAVGWSNGND